MLSDVDGEVVYHASKSDKGNANSCLFYSLDSTKKRSALIKFVRFMFAFLDH